MEFTGSIYMPGCISFEIIRIQMGGTGLSCREGRKDWQKIVSGNETAHTDTQVLYSCDFAE
jgi:hypothetical protein